MIFFFPRRALLVGLLKHSLQVLRKLSGVSYSPDLFALSFAHVSLVDTGKHTNRSTSKVLLVEFIHHTSTDFFLPGLLMLLASTASGL